MNLTNAIASLLAAVSGLLAAAATIFSQASLRHRMMKTSSWAHEQTSSIDERNDYLINMQRWAQSEVVAATIVPPKAFFWLLFYSVMLVASAVFPGLALWFRSWLGVSRFVIIVLSLETFCCSRIVLLYLKRRIISIRYYEGEKIESMPAKLCEFGKSTWLLSFIYASTLTFLSVSLGLLVHRGWGIMFLCSVAAIVTVWNCINDTRSQWIHPFLLDRAS